MSRKETKIDALANDYSQKVLDLSPETVTSSGLPGADESTYSDYSPAGLAEMADLQRATLDTLATLTPVDDVDRVTVAAMNERLGLDLAEFDSFEFGDINNITTPVQGIAEIYDLMPTDTKDDWSLIIRRLHNVSKALAGWQETLALRTERGPAHAERQVDLAITETQHVASETSSLAKLAERGAAAFPELAEELEAATAEARHAYGKLSNFLATEIAPHATKKDAFGRERYQRRIRQFVGAELDLDETYEWGLAELARIDSEQRKVCQQLYGPGVSLKETMERLNNDPSRQLHGKDALKEWMQGISDQAVAELGRTHFEIPEPMQTIECMIAPSGTGAIYYTGPSDDFKRPGRMWWSVPEGTDTFTTWQEKTTVYHEGVPGHHLQVGYTTYLREELNTWRRNFCWVSGHGEGWALYAEGLMRELGYMDDPGDYLGVLDGERLRASRVVLDIGVHLEKEAPAAYQHINKHWNRDVAWQFLQDNVAMDRSFLLFELNRYLGWAGQAPSYKIGHRMWKELRAEAKQRAGADFHLKDWHTKALSVGSVGLDVLREALA